MNRHLPARLNELNRVRRAPTGARKLWDIPGNSMILVRKIFAAVIPVTARPLVHSITRIWPSDVYAGRFLHSPNTIHLCQSTIMHRRHLYCIYTLDPPPVSLRLAHSHASSLRLCAGAPLSRSLPRSLYTHSLVISCSVSLPRAVYAGDLSLVPSFPTHRNSQTRTHTAERPLSIPPAYAHRSAAGARAQPAPRVASAV